ncbi:MAG: urate hydroxylase PuuD [Kofleriaceae bacterium]
MTLNELLDVVFRWAHVIAGIMWIGNSMLFNWLDRNLEKSGPLSRLSQGKIFMVHSGAFYDVEKKLLAPGEMPDNLHWFKWQNGITWLTGISLLVVVYFMNTGFLVDPTIHDIEPAVAITLSVCSLLGGWIIYDGLWRSYGERNPRFATVLSIILLFGAVIGFSLTLSGRAAFVMTGVLIGTLMTGNVWMCIVPSQRSLIAATMAGREQDPVLSLRAKQRSIHNNYLTFPLLFMMVSNHFSAAISHQLNWLVLISVLVGGAGIRHFMNIRYRGEGKQLATAAWLIPVVAMAGIAIVGLMVVTRIRVTPAGIDPDPVSFETAQGIIAQRCVRCHSARPSDPIFREPPLGVMFDTPKQIRLHAERIFIRAVELKTMPLNNQTDIRPKERAQLGRWIVDGAKLE